MCPLSRKEVLNPFRIQRSMTLEEGKYDLFICRDMIDYLACTSNVNISYNSTHDFVNNGNHNYFYSM